MLFYYITKLDFHITRFHTTLCTKLYDVVILGFVIIIIQLSAYMLSVVSCQTYVAALRAFYMESQCWPNR